MAFANRYLLWIVLAASALAVVVPFAWLGIPSGHDFEFHLNSWLEVHQQWTQGILYPRWADLAHFGYGEARFVFYPPASWMLGAALGGFLPWSLVPATYIWIALTLSGYSMFCLARRWLGPRDALFAACLYLANPYHLVIVYWRSDFAELLAGAVPPLLLLYVLRLEEEHWGGAIPLGLVVAAVWLINAPAAVIATYSLALQLVVVAAQRKSWRVLAYGGAGLLVGLGLAAFYILPAAYEERWVNIAEVLSGGVRPQDNFLFHRFGDADHDRFNHLVSLVALAEVLVVMGALAASRKLRVRNRIWAPLAAWASVGAILMFYFSVPAWTYLPELRFVQFPWRWLLVVDIGLAWLVALAWRRWWQRLLIGCALLGIVIFVWQRIQPPWWDHADDVAEMAEALRTGHGYEGVDEYVPAGADSYDIDLAARRVWLAGPGHAHFRVLKWGAEGKEFTAEVDQPTQAALRLFNYPAWRVEVNGQPVAAATREGTGEIVVPLATGTNDVMVRLQRTGDRTLGGAISTVTLVGLMAGFLIRRRRERGVRSVLIATSNAGKLRDFAGAAASYGVKVASLPGFASLPPVVEDGATFEENARKKAEAYSRYSPGRIVLADDSGLEVDALGGAPGVHSARYAAEEPHRAESNTDDQANNARLIRELRGVSQEKRTGRFVCVIAVARDGKTLATFRGAAGGIILDSPRGKNGFGYDPLFYFPGIGKTFAELTAEEKAQYSHRGAAFRKFLQWAKDGAI